MPTTFDTLARERRIRSRRCGRSVTVACALALLLASAASALAADPKPATPSRKKVQEVDLHSLEIKGRLDTPSSLFLLEKGASSMTGWTLEGLLGNAWILPIEKQVLDRQMLTGGAVTLHGEDATRE